MFLDWKNQFCKMTKLHKAINRFKLVFSFIFIQNGICIELEILWTHKTPNSQDNVGKEQSWKDFIGGPVAKTPFSQCRGPRFDP